MAKDIYHEIVKQALIKDGWTITNDPYFLSLLDNQDLNKDSRLTIFMVLSDFCLHNPSTIIPHLENLFHY